MTSTTTVRAHTRRKPEKTVDPFQAEISRRLAQIREQAEADRAVNSFRAEIRYQPGTSALLLIAGRLKVLALKAKEILN